MKLRYSALILVLFALLLSGCNKKLEDCACSSTVNDKEYFFRLGEVVCKENGPGKEGELFMCVDQGNLDFITQGAENCGDTYAPISQSDVDTKQPCCCRTIKVTYDGKQYDVLQCYKKVDGHSCLAGSALDPGDRNNDKFVISEEEWKKNFEQWDCPAAYRTENVCPAYEPTPAEEEEVCPMEGTGDKAKTSSSNCNKEACDRKPCFEGSTYDPESASMLCFDDGCKIDEEGDGMADPWEEENELDPVVDDSALDPDEDGLTNKEEFDFGSDPNKKDTDEDGWDDKKEKEEGTDPNKKDTDDDGIIDPEDDDPLVPAEKEPDAEPELESTTEEACKEKFDSIYKENKFIWIGESVLDTRKSDDVTATGDLYGDFPEFQYVNKKDGTCKPGLKAYCDYLKNLDYEALQILVFDWKWENEKCWLITEFQEPNGNFKPDFAFKEDQFCALMKYAQGDKEGETVGCEGGSGGTLECMEDVKGECADFDDVTGDYNNVKCAMVGCLPTYTGDDYSGCEECTADSYTDDTFDWILALNPCGDLVEDPDEPEKLDSCMSTTDELNCTFLKTEDGKSCSPVYDGDDFDKCEDCDAQCRISSLDPGLLTIVNPCECECKVKEAVKCGNDYNNDGQIDDPQCKEEEENRCAKSGEYDWLPQVEPRDSYLKVDGDDADTDPECYHCDDKGAWEHEPVDMKFCDEAYAD